MGERWEWQNERVWKREGAVGEEGRRGGGVRGWA